MQAVERLPPRTLPVIYVAAAHVSLALAFLVIALEPTRLMGFFYHPKLIAVEGPGFSTRTT